MKGLRKGKTEAEAPPLCERGPPSLLSQIFFTYVSPVIVVAKKVGSLDLPDIPRHVRLTTAQLFNKFDGALQARKAKAKPGSTDVKNIVAALMYGRKGRIGLTAIGYLISQATTLAGPLLLNRIVKGLTCQRLPAAVSNGSCDSQATLYGCATLVAGDSPA